MSSGRLQQLVKMANQIALNLGSQRDPQKAALSTADHMRRFWTADMLEQLNEHCREGGDDLDSVVVSALQQLQERTA